MKTIISVVVLGLVIFVGTVCCRHAPLYDGTARTLPKNLTDNSIMGKIEKNNEEHMTVQDKKEVHIFEGDIALTADTIDRVDTSQTSSSNNANIDVNSITSKKTAIRSRANIWPSRTIPIQLTKELAHARVNILAALGEITSKTCIRFRDKVASDKRWIKMVKKTGCWSAVGRQVHQQGGQELSIGDGCNFKGTIIHEIMHALGFWHEQSRTDRDNYVNILWENVDKGQQNNFNRYNAAQMDMVGGMYDFDSIMHYGNFAFSKNKSPTMLSIKNPSLVFGRRRSTLSETDVLQLNVLYDCSTKSGGWSSWTAWGPCDLRCTKKRERFCTDKSRAKCPLADINGIQAQIGLCVKEECNVPVPGHWGRWAPWGSCSSTTGHGYRTRTRACDNPKPQNEGKFCEGTLLETKNC